MTGCSFQENGPLCLEDCDLCGPDGICPPDRCGLELIMALDCEGKLESAEVAVDQCVQPDELTPGGRFVACATIPKGQTRQVVIRSQDWVWKTTALCPAGQAGQVVPVAVYCLER